LAIVITDWEIYAVIYLWIQGRIIAKFGGMRIAYYRARGIQFFSYVKKDASGNRRTITKRMTALKHDSPMAFEDDEGLRFWPEGDKAADYIDRWFTGPLVEYRIDDARPMPISKRDGILMAPQSIIKPFKDKSTTDLNRIGQKTPRLETFQRLLIIFILLGVAAMLYYQLYYGQNIACAVHAKGVACG
jgi:hypothetical protein